MQEYRVYWFDGEGHVEQAEWIQAEHDDAAVESIRAIKRRSDWELWRGRERVASSKP